METLWRFLGQGLMGFPASVVGQEVWHGDRAAVPDRKRLQGERMLIMVSGENMWIWPGGENGPVKTQGCPE